MSERVWPDFKMCVREKKKTTKKGQCVALCVREKMGQCVREAHLLQLFRDPHARVDSLSALRVLGLVVLQEVTSG